jgi:hypothetical protein
MHKRYTAPILFVILFLVPFTVAAGPPYITDDPEPLQRHHGEFLVASQILNAIDRFSIVLPGVEFNFGLTDNVMSHLIVPFILSKPDSHVATFSPGDVELGLKFRFFNETNLLPQIGTFPHLEIPIGDSAKGAGSGSVEVFIPVWFQKEFGPWTTYGGGGLWVQIAQGSTDFCLFGWEIQRELGKKLTLGAKLFATTGSFESARAQIGLNVGGSFDFSNAHHTLFSIGREIKGSDKFLMYLAYQLTFGGLTGKKGLNFKKFCGYPSKDPMRENDASIYEKCIGRFYR